MINVLILGAVLMWQQPSVNPEVYFFGPHKSFYERHFPHAENPWPSNRTPRWTERRPTQVV